MLRVEGVSKRFGGVQAVRDVTLQCAPGEILGLIGPNGAGKSSLINIMSGVLSPDTGLVEINGQNIAGKDPGIAAKAGIGRTFQNLRLFTTLSVLQNIEVTLTSARAWRPDKAASFEIMELCTDFGLSGRVHMQAGTLSYGDQRRVEILRALALLPSVLLMDEPAAGMNDEESAVLAGLIRSIRDRFGCGIIVIDHDLRFIMGLCERIVVMDMGAVIAAGPTAEVRRNPKVIDVYLGSEAA